MDILTKYCDILPVEQIHNLREVREEELLRISHWDNHRQLITELPVPSTEEIVFSGGETISLRATSEFEVKHATLIEQLVKSVFPWRKGPLNFLGVEIDAEWRSEMKWKRIKPYLPEMRGRRVADIGCNNGYYLFRMLRHNPELLLGLDPSSRCYYQFHLFQRVLQDPRCHFELLGIEHMGLFEGFFDVVFCLGVLYHRRDPYTSCRMLFESLRTRGTLFLESLIYPGEEPIAFCPPDRYAKMRNVWYLPTVNCLKVWLEKAGFVEVEEIATSVVTTEEQRQTPLAPYESLADFLDPEDSTKTIEGHPAPVRSILRAVKGESSS